MDMEFEALIIGRFQPFHYGHLHAVKYVLEREGGAYIGVGSALEAYTKRNPFTFAERFRMIVSTLREEGIDSSRYYIFPIPDSDIHTTWVSIVETIVPPFKRVYSNDPLTRSLMRRSGYEVRRIPLYQRKVFSGEEFRRRVVAGEEWSELIPTPVKEILIREGLIERLVELWRDDKSEA